MSATTPSYTKLGGVFHIVHSRGGEVLSDTYAKNAVVQEGLQNIWGNFIGETVRGSLSQWYVGLLTGKPSVPTPELQDDDTWSGVTINNNERWTIAATRLGWGGLLDPISFNAASGGTIVAPAVILQTVLCTFGQVLDGIFITNVGTTSISSGILFCTAAVSISNVNSGDILTVGYTLVTSTT